MDWEQVEHLVESQIAYWQGIGKHNWANGLERCLAESRRHRNIRDVALDLRQRYNWAEDTQEKTNNDAHCGPDRP
jgi:hypothetical protein